MRNHAWVNSEVARDVCLSLAAGAPRCDGGYLLSSQFSVPVSLAVCAAHLLRPVFRVGCWVSCEQVIRTNTRRVIAAVQHIQWQRPKGYFKTQAVREYGPATHRQESVPVNRATTYPEPTFIGFVYLFPESLSSGPLKALP